MLIIRKYFVTCIKFCGIVANGTRLNCVAVNMGNSNEIQNTTNVGNEVLADVSESCINFAIWVQDNYSQNKYANTHEMLPKGQMRKDFTNDIYTMSEIWQHYNFR